MSWRPTGRTGGKGQGGTVPRDPFLGWYREYRETHAYQCEEDIAEEFGVSARSLHRWRSEGPGKRIGLDVVDMICTRIDDPGLLNELYPVDGGMAVAA